MSDTGPPYPPGPLPESNAIGQFAIGVSPVGTIPAFNWWATVISQYANSGVLTTLLGNWFDALDQTEDLDEFYDLIWNVATSQGYGLDVWGRIVGVTRNLQVATLPIGFLGFEEAGNSSQSFGFGVWYSGSGSSTGFSLEDPDFRTLIFAKALSNISDGSNASINQILLALFPGRGNCFVIDNENMSMVYQFDFALSAVELAIIGQTGVLPKPGGVSATISQTP